MNWKVGDYVTLNQWGVNGVYKGAYVKIIKDLGFLCYVVRLDKPIRGHPRQITVSSFSLLKD